MKYGNTVNMGSMRDARNMEDVGSSLVSSLSHRAQPPLGGRTPACYRCTCDLQTLKS